MGLWSEVDTGERKRRNKKKETKVWGGERLGGYRLAYFLSFFVCMYIHTAFADCCTAISTVSFYGGEGSAHREDSG